MVFADPFRESRLVGHGDERQHLLPEPLSGLHCSGAQLSGRLGEGTNLGMPRRACFAKKTRRIFDGLEFRIPLLVLYTYIYIHTYVYTWIESLHGL